MRPYENDSAKQIHDYDTIESIFGRQRKYENVRDDPRFIQFTNALRSIQDFCKNRYIDLGEAITIIGKNFGYTWDTIPFGKIPEIKEFVENNWFRFFEILESEKHRLIMATPDADADQYREFYNSRGQSGHKTMRQIDANEFYWMKE